MSKIFNSQIVSSKGIQNEKLEQCKDRKDCSCSFCALSNFNEFENNNINRFLCRTRYFPRKSIRLLTEKDFKPGHYKENKGNVIEVITEGEIYHGYAWIGAAEHNKENGCKGVDKYNYVLISPNYLTIYFKPIK